MSANAVGDASHLSVAAQQKAESYRTAVVVEKPIPYTFDLGNLLCNDENAIAGQPTDAQIASISRDCAQAMINQLLTTCEIRNTADGTLMTLPATTTALPREKMLPVEKSETKWERFARKKGIKKSRDSNKTVYDEAKGDWVPKWGYKGANKDGEEDWIVEVDEKKEQDLKGDQTLRSASREQRRENLRRNERKQRANERKTRVTGQAS